MLFYLATKTFLKQYHPVAKFVAVKTVIFFTFWQGLVIDLVPGPTAEESHMWTVRTASGIVLKLLCFVVFNLELSCQWSSI